MSGIERLRDQLSKPISIPGEPWFRGTSELFDPWEIFPALYGSYSSLFDDMAILVLENIRDRRFGAAAGEDLAHEMFREMLCTSDFCEYGTSPRSCWAHGDFAELLPSLIEKWKAYRFDQWEREDEA